MANTIILKRSATPGKVPTASQLALGEIAINTHDGLLYIKKDDGVSPSVVQIGGVTSVNGETGTVTLDSGDVAEGSNLYFTQARARAAVSAGTGISYNASTGVISTAQNLTSAAKPTFAGLTLTNGVDITGDIIPTTNNTYSLGSPTKVWKDVYVGPGTLYVNGSPVITDNSGTMTFTADIDQNIRLTTTGTGVLQLGSSSTNVNVDGTLQIASGKNITDSAGVEVNFGDNIDMNNNKIVGLGAPSAGSDAATKTYVDSSISAISTSSIAYGNSNVAVVDNGTGTVTVTVDGSTALTVTSAGVVVAGNFTVEGTTTTVQANTINLADNIITLNSDATGTPTQNAGLEVERGDEANVQLRWNEGTQKWTFTNDGAVYQPIAASTSDLAEGTNLYYTTARARTAFNANTSSGVSYNSSTGLISLGSIPNSSLTNSSFTIGTTLTSLGATATVLDGLTSITSSSFVGALTGNADTATKLATTRTIALTGDATASGTFDGSANYSQALTLATVNSNVGQFGSTTAIPVITVNAKGLVTAVSTTPVSIPSGSLTFTGDVIGSGTTGSSTTLSIKSSPTLTTPVLSGTTTVSGNLIPSADLTYDLGDSTHRFRNLYLSGSTIAIAGSTSGQMTLSAPAIAGTTAITFPATTGTVVTTGDVGTITSTMIAAGTVVNSATKLAVPRAIQGVNFDGTAPITVVTAGSGITVTGTTVAVDSTIATAASVTEAVNTVFDSIATKVALDGSTPMTGELILSGNPLGDLSAVPKQYVDQAILDQTIYSSDDVQEGSTNLYYTDARVATRVGSGLTNFHSAFQSVTSAQATTNATGTVAFTFADLATAKHYNVYVNRTLLRPTEFSVSGSTVTVVAGVLSTDDEIEVTGLKFA
jgi:hypothetical protein